MATGIEGGLGSPFGRVTELLRQLVEATAAQSLLVVAERDGLQVRGERAHHPDGKVLQVGRCQLAIDHPAADIAEGARYVVESALYAARRAVRHASDAHPGGGGRQRLKLGQVMLPRGEQAVRG